MLRSKALRQAPGGQEVPSPGRRNSSRSRPPGDRSSSRRWASTSSSHSESDATPRVRARPGRRAGRGPGRRGPVSVGLADEVPGVEPAPLRKPWAFWPGKVVPSNVSRVGRMTAGGTAPRSPARAAATAGCPGAGGRCAVAATPGPGRRLGHRRPAGDARPARGPGWSSSWSRTRRHPVEPASQAREVLAERGRPGSLVAIESNSPRTSRGASGLGSSVSRWLGPPGQKARITPRIGRPAGGPAIALKRSTSEKLRPSRGKAPAAQATRDEKDERGESCGWARHDDSTANADAAKRGPASRRRGTRSHHARGPIGNVDQKGFPGRAGQNYAMLTHRAARTHGRFLGLLPKVKM